VRPGGRFVGKIFHGEAFQTARDRVRDIFTKVQIMKPSSVRSESYEIYIVGLNRR
jgi:23S rRNA (uridine2552-2'-O)-methyltransferase